MVKNLRFKSMLFAVTAALAMVACGGGGGDEAIAPEQDPVAVTQPTFVRVVSFGDSMSDVGSYASPGIAAQGGGKFTVNGAADGVWVEQLAKRLELPVPCAAQTGLDASGAFASLYGATSDNPNCFAYGQGGARVSNPVGMWNKALLQVPVPEAQFAGQMGLLTVPATAQVAKHLAMNGGTFNANDLITVLSGANDIFAQVDTLAAALAQATAGATSPEQAAAAVQATLQAVVPQSMAAMAQAGAEMAVLIKTQIVANGGKRVVALNLPNVSKTPMAVEANAVMPGVQQIIDQLTLTFNGALAAGLEGTSENVVLVDLYTENTDHHANPAAHGLTNVTDRACANRFPGAPQFLAPSLVCTTATLIPGDTSRFLFADDVHPAPYGHTLLSNTAYRALQAKGWI